MGKQSLELSETMNKWVRQPTATGSNQTLAMVVGGTMCYLWTPVAPFTNMV